MKAVVFVSTTETVVLLKTIIATAMRTIHVTEDLTTVIAKKKPCHCKEEENCNCNKKCHCKEEACNCDKKCHCKEESCDHNEKCHCACHNNCHSYHHCDWNCQQQIDDCETNCGDWIPDSWGCGCEIPLPPLPPEPDDNCCCNHCHFDCGNCNYYDSGLFNLYNHQKVAMAYVPRIFFNSKKDIYNLDTAFEKGTLFKELDKPFKGGHCR